jgi:ribosomal protein S18 acetylase RimI-like enzyme
MPPPLRHAAAHGISYRPGGEEDAPFFRDVYVSTRTEEVARTGWPAEMQAAFLLQQHEAQHSHYGHVYPDAERLVIERNDETIGRLYLEELAHELRIIDIAFLPNARGRGLGEAILRDIHLMASARGKPVGIHVEKHNPARRLYLRLGFEVKEDVGVYERMEWAAETHDL